MASQSRRAFSHPKQSRGHPLGRRKAVDLRQLEAETFILYPRSVRPGLADELVTACEKVGFTPRLAQCAPINQSPRPQARPREQTCSTRVRVAAP
jgi:hypothetical protein